MIWITKFYQDNSGASAMDYALLIFNIVTVIITAVALVGSSVQGLKAT